MAVLAIGLITKRNRINMGIRAYNMISFTTNVEPRVLVFSEKLHIKLSKISEFYGILLFNELS